MSKARAVASGRESTLHDHIRELRNRLFIVSIVFIVTSAIAYNYKDILVGFLLQPLGGEKLIYLNPGGGFSFIFSVTMYIGAAITVPFLVYHLYRFVVPALPPSAQKHSALVLLSSISLLIAGAAFGYFYAIPGALNFLNNFADGYVDASLTADSYLNFILAYTAGLGMLFQLPLILLFIHWVHPLKPGDLLKFERYMVLIAFIAAALITPTPDVLNQTVIALPIILMYQIGVIAVSVSVYRSKKRLKNQQAPETMDIPDEILPELQPATPVLATTQFTPMVTVPSVSHAPITTAKRSFDIMPRHAKRRPLPQRTRPANIQIPGRPVAVSRPANGMRSIDGVFVTTS